MMGRSRPAMGSRGVGLAALKTPNQGSEAMARGALLALPRTGCARAAQAPRRQGEIVGRQGLSDAGWGWIWQRSVVENACKPGAREAATVLAFVRDVASGKKTRPKKLCEVFPYG
jgi:hypothetical protein